MWKWGVFLAASAGIVLFSRHSLRSLRAHGFYRFFAFESILAIILLNLDAWLLQPFSPRQLASWVLLLASAGLALHGFWLLKRQGKPDASIDDPTRLDVEKTTRLVTAGAYRWIRHPLYASLLCLGWGAFLKLPSAAGLLLALLNTLALVLTARVEEQENLKNFGLEYTDYMKRTKMFIPWVL